MVSRSHVLYCILLPLLAQVAAEAEAEEQIIAEVMSRSHEGSDSSRSTSSSEHHLLPNPLPPSFLLQLLHSGALQQLQQQHNDDTNNGEFSSDAVDDDNDNVAAEEMAKRVFCNGFTGCGGRHRDRSRRQEKYGKRLIPVLVKRPFCNSFGCYNGKRSSIALPIASSGPAATFRARTMAQALGMAGEEEGGRAPGKRLFCNGYGGCRGGKRSLFSPWMSKMNSVAEGRR